MKKTIQIILPYLIQTFNSLVSARLETVEPAKLEFIDERLDFVAHQIALWTEKAEVTANAERLKKDLFKIINS